MEQEKFEEIVKLIKGAIINENLLRAEIRHKQQELEKIQENKMTNQYTSSVSPV